MLQIFFNVGPHNEDIFSGRLLSPVFQSLLHITFLQVVPYVWYAAIIS